MHGDPFRAESGQRCSMSYQLHAQGLGFRVWAFGGLGFKVLGLGLSIMEPYVPYFFGIALV